MSKVNTDAIKPRDTGLDITLGATGDTTVISANSINTNTIKDSGGNTLWTSDGSGNLSSVNAGLKGNLLLLSTQTASGSASISFTTGIDSTYDVYCFTFFDINPATDLANFRFQGSSNGGSSYGITKTSTWFKAQHEESDASYSLSYDTSYDLAQSTNHQIVAYSVGSDADQSVVGELFLFNPSNTTYVKNFYATVNSTQAGNETSNNFIAGYFNTTSAIDAIQWSMSSGNFDGTIKMYGLL